MYCASKIKGKAVFNIICEKIPSGDGNMPEPVRKLLADKPIPVVLVGDMYRGANKAKTASNNPPQ